MNCREYQHQIVLFLYEELPEPERAELEVHLLECDACKAALAEERSLHSVLGEDTTAWDVPSDLLVESRKSLADELDRVEQKRAWWRIPTFSVVFTPMRLLESAALIAMGLALGVYMSSQRAVPERVASNEPSPGVSVIPQNAIVSNLRIVDANTSTGEVELAGEMLQPLRFQGNMDDDTIRRLLLNALSDASNPRSRLHAVEVLSREPTDNTVKEALIRALVSDETPAVRQIALEGLIPFAGEEDVRTALIHALANDRIEGIRLQAIEALARYSKDESVARTIQQLTKDDDNPYVRAKGLQFVGNLSSPACSLPVSPRFSFRPLSDFSERHTHCPSPNRSSAC
jgi:hypothetical protein